MAQSQVHSLCQDRRGYLWIGTLGGGISRFDGSTFTHFNTGDGLSDNHVLTIFEDSNGYIWIGTMAGLNRYDGRSFHRPHTGNSLYRSEIRAIREDLEGNLWFGTDNGAWKYDRKTREFARFTVKQGLSSDLIESLLVDRRGNLWLGTEGGGVNRYDGETFTGFSTKDGLVHQTVFSILEDKQGNLWFGTPNGVSRYDGKSLESFKLEEGLNNSSIRTIMEDRQGNLWFGTDGAGVCCFDGETFTRLTEKNGLSSNVVWSLLEDREGNIWIGTYRGGLDKYGGGVFTCFSSKDGLAGDVIRSILLDRQGHFWFGTYRGGVSRWDGKSLRTFTTKDGLVNNFVLTIYEDRQGNLWFGTYGGISRYDGQKFMNLTPKEGLADPVVRAILEDRGGRIWIGTNHRGISIYDGRTFTNFSREDGLNDNRITTLLEDRQGKIWIGTLNGICLYDGRRFVNISRKWDLPHKNIYSIIEDGSGNLWIAAFGEGIIKYTPHLPVGSFDVFNSRDGLEHSNVVSLCFDDTGKLWAGTEKGIYRFNTEAYNQGGRKIFKHYGLPEGFIGIECIHNSILKDNQGNIWFGTLKGAIRYNPRMDRPNRREPLIHITNVRPLFAEENLAAYSQGISPENGLPMGLKLPYSKNNLLFEFIGISLTVPERIKYKCKLEGFDKFWVPVKTGSTATYSNIPPGRYSFKVRASNNDGIWNRKPASFAFEIIPPFWQTWWFYLLCAAGLATGTFFIIKHRVGHLEKQRRNLQEKVLLSTRELQQEKDKVERINLELEQRVSERTSELLSANRTLEAEIKERKQIEEALRESEEKFRAIAENALEAIFIVQDGVIKFPNPRAEEMFGYSAAELDGIPIERFIYPQDREKKPAQSHRIPGSDTGIVNSCFRIINRIKNELFTELNSVSINWDGKPATLNFLRDITEKKKLETQLLQAQKMEAIGTMAGGIAHNFNNLLTGILGNTSIILGDTAADNPHYEELKQIEENVQSGVHLTRQLLGFARSGKYEVKVTDLNLLIQKSTEMFGRTRREIHFQEKYAADLWPVEVDKAQLEQVMLNLYVNAWQAMPEGGSIFIQTGNISLDVNEAQTRGLEPGRYVKVSVTDTGVGMDEVTRKRIFEPFFTTKDMGHGTGLGLASAYGIILNHSGCIQVYSEKGNGTTFNIYLPASNKRVDRVMKTAVLPEDFLRGTETILLVDDEEGIISVGEKLLKRLGYRTLPAKNGYQAMETVKKNMGKIDLIILDMIMPGLGGAETFNQLRKIDPEIKVLLSSGYSLNDQAARILEQGCNGFIQKPFHLKELSYKIRTILDQSQ